MGIYTIKPKFQKVLSPLKNLFIKLKIHPTAINILALIISLTGAIALYFSENYPLILLHIPIMAFIRTALNALDGLVARELKIKNQKFGEVLNEFTDRLSDTIIFTAFIFMQNVNTQLATVTLALILLSSYIAVLNKSAGGSRLYLGIIGKADRMLYLSIAALLTLILQNSNIFNYLLIFLSLGTIITIIQRFLASKKELYKK